jgi:hypothetical protein
MSAVDDRPKAGEPRKRVRYEVKVDDQLLTFGSLHELRNLYVQGFVSPEDLVRPEGGERWVRAGTMPVLRAAQPKAKIETRMVVIVTMALIFSLVVGTAILKYRMALIGLVLLGVTVPFIAYRKRR